MFGNLFKAFSTDVAGVKTIHVLIKTFSLEISHPEHLSMMERIAQDYGNTYNEHELAVQFLAEFSNTVKVDHPKARTEIEKYVRMSKGAYNRGLACMIGPQQRLFKVARERFGVEPDDIAAG